jgi:hypothetical protein
MVAIIINCSIFKLLFVIEEMRLPLAWHAQFWMLPQVQAQGCCTALLSAGNDKTHLFMHTARPLPRTCSKLVRHQEGGTWISRKSRGSCQVRRIICLCRKCCWINLLPLGIGGIQYFLELYIPRQACIWWTNFPRNDANAQIGPASPEPDHSRLVG